MTTSTQHRDELARLLAVEYAKEHPAHFQAEHYDTDLVVQAQFKKWANRFLAVLPLVPARTTPRSFDGVSHRLPVPKERKRGKRVPWQARPEILDLTLPGARVVSGFAENA